MFLPTPRSVQGGGWKINPHNGMREQRGSRGYREHSPNLRRLTAAPGALPWGYANPIGMSGC